MFKIDKGMPVPDATWARREPVYPFSEMKVGDSFELREDDYAELRLVRQRLMNAAARYGRRHKMKFTTRRTAVNAVRIWRVK
ncbi:MAG TPA: hypothetical protein VH854_07385 [Thermoanaerobaculia bacterium]|jgi:hypothetical protein|nr:hypothetical protein [Thermoanaerobaculia bacterium]